LLVVAAAHLIVGLVHYQSHMLAGVQNTPFQLLFILLVVTIAPWVAVYLAFRASLRTASAMFALTMAASFLFGFLLHFVIEGPDLYSNVTAVHQGLFLQSAVGLALAEFSGVVMGTYIWFRGANPC